MAFLSPEGVLDPKFPIPYLSYFNPLPEKNPLVGLPTFESIWALSDNNFSLKSHTISVKVEEATSQVVPFTDTCTNEVFVEKPFPVIVIL